MPGISVIIPTYNEEENIERMLEVLSRQLMPGDEVIVVDGHSTDRTVEVCQRYGATVYPMDRLGIGPAKTYGSERAKNDIVAHLDADGFPGPGWLPRIRELFSDPGVNAAAGLGFYVSDSRVRGFLYNLFARLVFYGAYFGYSTRKIPWMPVNDCVLRKDRLLDNGGFGAVVCEDLDFSMRARGMPGMVYDKNLRVWLSDRRFKEDGFVNTVLLWLKSDMKILGGQGIDSRGYRT